MAQEREIVRVHLKNVGSAMRVVSDAHGNQRPIPINGEADVEIVKSMADRYRRAQEAGDTLLMSSISNRVRIKPPPTGELPPRNEKLTAGMVLNAAPDLSYEELLAHARKVVGDARLPNRPKKPEILSALQEKMMADNGVKPVQPKDENAKKPIKAKASTKPDADSAEDVDDDADDAEDASDDPDAKDDSADDTKAGDKEKDAEDEE